MIRLAVRTARAHLLRSLLSSLAVVLGVAFVAGTLMFTDGLASSLTRHAADQYRNIDVEVTQRSSRWPDDIADRVRRVDGVRAAEATWTLFDVGLAAGDGRKVRGAHRAVNVAADPGLQPYAAARGRMPAAAGEVVLDEHTADREGLAVGDRVRISNGGTARTGTLVGVTATATGAVDRAGALLIMTTADVAALAGYPPSTVVVAADAGVSAEALAGRIAAAVDADVATHDQLVRTAVAGAVGDAETFRTGLLGIGAIAVGMAAFVIANTFTIVLAQRSREIALLRLVGATRRQVFRSVLAEAAVIGVGGSALGLAAGVLLAHVLPATLAAIGAAAPVTPVMSARTVLVALLIGVGVTVLSAILPARRGTRVAPVAALSDAEVHVARPLGRARRVWGVLTVGAGLAGLAGAAAIDRLAPAIAGLLLTVLGFLLLSPLLVPALVRLVGRPVAALGGTTVALALLNAVRNPRRIATTTNALVVGVTLVGTLALLAESAQAPAERRADEKLFAQFLISESSGWKALPAGLLDALRRQPELGPATPSFQAFDESTGLEVRTGRDTAPGSAVVSADLGVAPGGVVTVQGRRFTVASVASGDRVVWLTATDLTALFGEPQLTEAQVDPAPGVSTADARAALDRALAGFPSAVAYDHAGYVAELNAKVNQALAVVTALLLLAVLIALVGVANTLTLSVVERTRENALLRAVGLTRRQLRLTLAAEALVMALTGTLIGLAISLVATLSVLDAVVLQGDGLDLAVPWGRLAALLAIAVVAALLASVLPARRAVRRPIVAGLADE